MAPHMHALACSQGQEKTHFSLKYFEVRVTIAAGGMDIDVSLLVKLRRFIEEECLVGLYSVELGGALTHNHFKWSRRGTLAAFRCCTRKSRFVWVGMSLLPWVMLSHARG